MIMSKCLSFDFIHEVEILYDMAFSISRRSATQQIIRTIGTPRNDLESL